jgi:hypothetical protein
MEYETQYTYLVDRNGRGWRLEHLERLGKRCYRAGCNARPGLEMTRQNGWMVRREQLCSACYNERVDLWGLKKVRSSTDE